MIELAGTEEAYSMKLMKRKLEMRYSGESTISNIPGKLHLVGVKDAARLLIEN